MLIERCLRGHSIMGLSIHSLSAETSITTTLAIIAELTHVVGVISIVVVWVVVWVAAGGRLSVGLMHMLGLRSRSSGVLAAQRRVWRGMATVLSLIVPALALFVLLANAADHSLKQQLQSLAMKWLTCCC